MKILLQGPRPPDDEYCKTGILSEERFTLMLRTMLHFKPLSKQYSYGEEQTPTKITRDIQDFDIALIP